MFNFIKHDVNASSDSKVLRLRMKHKSTGYGVFWLILEKLTLSGGELEADFNTLGYEFRESAELVKSVVCDFGLFVFSDDGKRFSSLRLLQSIEEMQKKSEKAKESVKKRWEKYKGNTNVIRTYNERNTNVIQNRIEENRLEENNIIPPKSPLGGTADKKSLDLPPEFQTAVFGDAWTRWLKYRKEIRKKITESTAAGQVKKLMNLSQGKDSVAADIIQQSIDNGWQGLFPLKDQPSRSKGSVKDLMEDIDNILGGSDDNVNGV